MHCFRFRGRMNYSVKSAAAVAPILPIDTFKRGFGAIFSLFRISRIRRQLFATIQQHRIDKVVVLISHVWTPLIADSIRSAGRRYVVVVHDATNHPGDATAMVNWWLMRDALKADEVITLSAHVTSALMARFPQLAGRTKILFLPDYQVVDGRTPDKKRSSAWLSLFWEDIGLQGAAVVRGSLRTPPRSGPRVPHRSGRGGLPRRLGRQTCRA